MEPDHLPECYNSKRQRFAKPCICDRLRACEQRLMRDGITKSHGVWHDGYGEGYAAGVQAARDAVAVVHRVDDAIAAIDALRGDRYSDSHQPQVDGTEAHCG